MSKLYNFYTGKRIRKIKPYTSYWEKLANQLSRTALHIHPCRHCGGPVIQRYCCGRCGSSEP